ncbi:helix-turn-helix transcriptional regulator [Streptomyces sp.]|uniref:helix-turn-helix domain-containing protein n=1 Tax=Streptomyces sp. TaxID=1931 RepID=UPI002F92575A
MKRVPPMVTLRALREAHGLTLEQLAERIAEQGVTVDKASLANVELGNRRASRRLIGAHARALRLESVDIYQSHDLRALLEGDDERKTA